AGRAGLDQPPLAGLGIAPQRRQGLARHWLGGGARPPPLELVVYATPLLDHPVHDGSGAGPAERELEEWRGCERREGGSPCLNLTVRSAPRWRAPRAPK